MNPTGAPSFGSPPPGGGAPMDAAGIKEQLNVPSLILLIGAVLGVLMNLMGMVQNMLGGNSLKNIPPEMLNKPEMRQMLPLIEGLQKTGPFFSLINIGLCAFIAFGALKMRNLQSYTVAMVAAIFGIIPCCQSCCCIITMVGGIWALVVLMKPEVKAAFTN
jgi:hypothetical protein